MRVVTGSQRVGGGFSRLVWLIVILLAIVLVAGWFAVRTEGARGLLESHLGKELGIPLSVEATRIGWPYVLVLENVRTPDFEAAGMPGFSAAEVRLGSTIRDWRPRWNVRMGQLIVRVQEAEDGTVKPICFARLVALRTASMSEFVRLTDRLRSKQMRLCLRDSTLCWLNAEGEEIASVRDVDFCMTPASIERRPMHYFSLDIRSATGVALAEGHDLHWEWLTTQELAYIELSKVERQREGAAVVPVTGSASTSVSGSAEDPSSCVEDVPVQAPAVTFEDPQLEGVG